MKRFFQKVAVTGVLLIPFCASSQQSLQLRTSVSPPYQVMVNGELSGKSVQILQCVFDRMSIKPDISVVPRRRAEHDVEEGYANGYFSLISNKRSDKFATLSAPLALEKWFLVSTQQQSPIAIENLSNYRLGAVRGSNEGYWLEDQFSNVELQQTNTVEQLVKLTAEGRIDGFIADRRLLDEALAMWPAKQPRMRLQFLRYAQLGVYFRNDFLHRHPGFLQSFNRYLADCQPEHLELSSQERQYLITLLDPVLHKVINDPMLWRSLRQRKLHPLTKEDIARRNKLWEEAHESGSVDIDKTWIDHDSSIRLKQWLSQMPPGITEIIVFDQQGANLAISQMTTDYDQSDEPKYQQTVAAQNVRPYLSSISYDQSTRTFQTQLSYAIRDDAENFIGGVTVGLDIEAFLTGRKVPLEMALSEVIE
ncbi:hypothetical protein CWI84_04390 [Idiomarina tyrosinivorans]|uniref:Uncharacterized protein n=1 Tax=Idiomarina tyrosinivorans TaxID=1445662 RepID=A0A432ZSM0_9GAMM|nr:transporter substrate-binding domain-containing protein [Idiomarina tyrosinivorans]RUO80828.1 hypothetical protein CWI84_04390 [Idiomarina tyrosinivorans]